MADLTVETTGRAIEESNQQMTLAAAEDMLDGVTAVRIDANGKFEKADASVAGTADAYGVITDERRAGFAVTAIRRGIIVGLDLSGLAYGDKVFLSDTPGALADAAGTVSVEVGTVVPIPSNDVGSSPAKALLVECN